MIRYWILQAKHFYSTFSFRHKAEFFALMIILIAFFVTRGSKITTSLIADPSISAFGLASVITRVLLLTVAFTVPLVNRMVMPKKAGLTVFHSWPLGPAAVRQIFVMTHGSYLIPVLFFGVLCSLAFVNTAPTSAFYLLITVTVGTALMLFLLPAACPLNKRAGIWRFALYVSAYFLLWAIFYYLPEWTWQFDLLSLPFFALLLFQPIQNRSEFGQYFQLPVANQNSIKSKWSYRSIALPLPSSMRPLVRRNILGIIRNRRHIWLKIFTLFIYLVCASLLNYYRPEQYLSWQVLIAALLVWEHYSHQFNEKYVYPETASFFKTVPISYFKIWLSFYFSEFLYVIILLAIVLALMLAGGATPGDLGGLFIPLLLFAFFVLAVMNTIRLYFFDNPRLAGIAYHLLVILCFVMSINFFLVGPLVSLALIAYFFYLSGKEYAR